MDYRYLLEEELEFDYFNDTDHEEEQLKETARLNRRAVLAFEKQYGCTYPEFILQASTEKERIDLVLWSTAIRYLALNNEKVYEA